MKDQISAVVWIRRFTDTAKAARGRAMVLSAWRTSLFLRALSQRKFNPAGREARG